MQRVYIILFGILLTTPSFAQIDFNIFLSKRKLRKSLKYTYGYERRWSEFVCLSGDCKNGQGVFKSKGTKFTFYAKGQFKDGNLNGPGTVYLFNYKRDNRSRDHFDEELKKGEPTFNYFQDERCPDEIFKGYFQDNILTKGEYTYYGTGEGRTWIYEKMIMNYMNSLAPLLDYDYKKDLFLYQHRGQFKKGVLYTACELNTPDDEVIIACRAHKSIIKPSDKKGTFICKKFKNNQLLETLTLNGKEGKAASIRNISSKPKAKRTPNKPLRTTCHICRGKGQTKRRIWVVRDFKMVRMRNGYERKKMIRKENYEYTPGAPGPPRSSGKIGETRTRKLEDILIPCQTCKGKGYQVKK